MKKKDISYYYSFTIIFNNAGYDDKWNNDFC